MARNIAEPLPLWRGCNELWRSYLGRCLPGASMGGRDSREERSQILRSASRKGASPMAASVSSISARRAGSTPRVGSGETVFGDGPTETDGTSPTRRTISRITAGASFSFRIGTRRWRIMLRW